MTHVNLDEQPVAVREFFLNLSVTGDGSVMELDGRPVARVLPFSPLSNGSAEPLAWTPEQNRRRCELIDRKYAGVLDTTEGAELQALQTAMHRYLDAVAPLPTEGARKLYQELLEKAARVGTGE